MTRALALLVCSFLMTLASLGPHVAVSTTTARGSLKTLYTSFKTGVLCSSFEHRQITSMRAGVQTTATPGLLQSPSPFSIQTQRCVWVCGCVGVWVCGCVRACVSVCVCVHVRAWTPLVSLQLSTHIRGFCSPTVDFSFLLPSSSSLLFSPPLPLSPSSLLFFSPLLFPPPFQLGLHDCRGCAGTCRSCLQPIQLPPVSFGACALLTHGHNLDNCCHTGL